MKKKVIYAEIAGIWGSDEEANACPFDVVKNGKYGYESGDGKTVWFDVEEEDWIMANAFGSSEFVAW